MEKAENHSRNSTSTMWSTARALFLAITGISGELRIGTRKACSEPEMYERCQTKKQSGIKDVDVDDAVNCPVCEVELEAKDGPSLVRHVAACNQKRFGTRRRGLRNR